MHTSTSPTYTMHMSRRTTHTGRQDTRHNVHIRTHQRTTCIVKTGDNRHILLQKHIKLHKWHISSIPFKWIVIKALYKLYRIRSIHVVIYNRIYRNKSVQCVIVPLHVPRVTSLYYYTSSVYLSYDCGCGIHIRLHVINSAVYIAAFDAEGVRCGLLQYINKAKLFN